MLVSLRTQGNLVDDTFSIGGITAQTTTLQTRTTESVPTLKVGELCSSDSDCGTNEICNIASNVDIACTRGFCACKPCYAIDKTMHLCYPIVPRFLNDICFDSDHEILPKNSRCVRGVVRCKWGYAPSLVGGDCVRQRGVGGHMDICASHSQCLDGLVCRDFQCQCENVWQRFDNSTQMCVMREYGDSCTIEEECRVPGGEGVGFTYAGGTCYRGFCICDSWNMNITIGYIHPETKDFRTKMVCVNKAGEINVAKGANCTADPIRYSQHSSIRTCGATNMCYQCPEDFNELGNMGDGFCRKLKIKKKKVKILILKIFSKTKIQVPFLVLQSKKIAVDF